MLTQFNYDGYDFGTHKKAEAIVVGWVCYWVAQIGQSDSRAILQFIGCIGGLIQGLALIIVDVILRGQNKVNDTNQNTNVANAMKDAAGKVVGNYRAGPDRDTIMAGCVLRTFLCE